MKQIHIKKPAVVKDGNLTRLESDIIYDGIVHKTWFSVNSNNAKYLDTDTADAFVVGLLPRAVRCGYDILSDAPITSELLFNLETYVIPATYKYSSGRAHKTKIYAKPIVLKTCAAGVGTGVSGGIDSSDAILELLNNKNKYPDMVLTHLAYFTHDHNELVPGEVLEEWRVNQHKNERDKVYKIAKELKLPIVEIESNIYNVDNIDEVLACSMHGPANVLALKKLFKTYFSAGAYDLEDFSMKGGYNKDQALSDAFIFPMLSTCNLRFYMAGITRSRFEKTKFVSKQKWLFNNLNVCFPIKDTKCGVNCLAGKCMRTMWDLEIIGELDNYKSCLPIADFRKHKIKSILWLYKRVVKHDKFATESFNKALTYKTISRVEVWPIKVIYFLNSLFVRVVCLFIPVKKWRQTLRRHL